MLSQRPGKGRKWLVLPWNNKKKSNKIKGKNTFLQYQGIVREYVKLKLIGTARTKFIWRFKATIAQNYCSYIYFSHKVYQQPNLLKVWVNKTELYSNFLRWNTSFLRCNENIYY